MKKGCKILLLVLVISTGITKMNEAKSQPSVSFSVFYNSLKPYGRWVNNPTYGQVWISNTNGFRPYSTGGHWAYTDYGWTWVSDYNWGWAPFHYGRWAYEPAYGWFWVPGYEWAPAWVAWRGGGDYYGWAPLSPGLNISVGVSFGNSIPYDRWVFAPHRYITSPYISRYYVPGTRNVTIIKNTTVVNNVTVKNNVHYVAGPSRQDVERVNHTSVRTYTVANASKPGKTVVKNNTVNVYRPVVNNNNKTVVNQTTVNNNSNNTVMNKNNNNKVVNKNNGNAVSTKNNNNVSVANSLNGNNKPNVVQIKKNAAKVNKYQNSNQPVNKPVKQQAAEKINTVQKQVQQNRQQQNNNPEVAKRRNNNSDNNRRKK